MRAALFLASLAFGLSACAPENDDTSGASSPMPSYELASVGLSSEASVVEITVDQMAAAQQAGTARIIDVRRDDEVATGIIPGAEHIPMSQFDPAAVTAGDDRAIILYCRSGRRSQIVGEALAEHTGKPATHLEGGFEAWREARKDIAAPN